MLKYSATLESAKEYAQEKKLDAWIQLYLKGEGQNTPLSDGLKLCKRYYFSPVEVPLKLFKRCTGPEPQMEFHIDDEWFVHHVAQIEEAVKAGVDIPPMIVKYEDSRFELSDGNHRHRAYENLGIEKGWVIFWTTGEKDYQDFMKKFGEYVRDCAVIRR